MDTCSVQPNGVAIGNVSGDAWYGNTSLAWSSNLAPFLLGIDVKIAKSAEQVPSTLIRMAASIDHLGLTRRFGTSLIAISALLFAYVCALSIYRLVFHPLAKYPGPFWAGITSLYGAYHAWRGDLHIDMWRCHEKYGPYVRYGPNRLLINSLDGLKELYVNTKQTQKSADYNSMVHRVPNTFTEINKKVHERKRRIISHGFSDSALRSYEPRIIECIQQLFAQLRCGTSNRNGWSVPKNMGDLAGHFAFDVMTSVIYGMSYNLQGSPEYRYIVPAIAGLNVRTGVLSQAPIVAWQKLDRRIFREAIRCRRIFLRFVGKLMKDRMQATEISGDAFSILLKAKDPETHVSLDTNQLSAESVNLIVAGSDTTATSISSTTFYLTRYPDVYARAAEEVRSVFSDASEVRLGPKLNSCHYLRGCINEAMRMSPPVGSALWREVLPGGLVVDGNYIPPGYDVGTGIYSIHHNDQYFEEPFVFKPERWMNTRNSTGEAASSSEEQTGGRAAYNPFSLGARSCIGKALAINELMLTFASLFVEFDFRTAHCEDARMGEGNKDSEYGRHRLYEYQMQDYLIGCRNGPMIEVRSLRE